VENRLSNLINLQGEWNRIRKDRFYVRNYLYKYPQEKEKHLKEVVGFEDKISTAWLYEEDKKSFLGDIRNYKYDYLIGEDGVYNNNNGMFGSLKENLPMFLLFLSLGGLATVVFNQYEEKARSGQERGLVEGFMSKLDEIMRKRGVNYERSPSG